MTRGNTNSLEEESKILKIKQQLYDLIIKKSSLLDSEVIEVSQKLDKVLNEYSNLLNKEDK